MYVYNIYIHIYGTIHFMLVDFWGVEFTPIDGVSSFGFRLDRIGSGARLPQPESIRIHFRLQRDLCRSGLAPRLVDFPPVPLRILRHVRLMAWLPKVWKNIEFSWLLLRNLAFYLEKLTFLGCGEQPGGPNDDMNFGRPKKSFKNLVFLIYFFAARVRDQESRVQK